MVDAREECGGRRCAVDDKESCEKSWIRLKLYNWIRCKVVLTIDPSLVCKGDIDKINRNTKYSLDVALTVI